jgi:DNA-binding PadR family transcriptional regulator
MGYGIISDVERISDRHVRLRAGTLHAALDRPEGEGLVELDREEVVQGRLWRYYKLTAAGAECLSAEIHRLRRHANAASRRLRGGLAGVRSRGRYGVNALERRYWRLLSLYPRSHRDVHAEEMLGILLSSAKPEQRRPGIRETTDLVGGAVLIWLHQAQRVLRNQWAAAAPALACFVSG